MILVELFWLLVAENYSCLEAETKELGDKTRCNDDGRVQLMEMGGRELYNHKESLIWRVNCSQLFPLKERRRKWTPDAFGSR